MAKKPRTNLDEFNSVMTEHRRLFGSGAKVSAPDQRLSQPSADEAAMALRPRSSHAGKDIHLPLEQALDREGRVKK